MRLPLRASLVLLLTAAVGFAAGCGGRASIAKSSGTTVAGSANGNNVMPIAVDGGPSANQATGSVYEDAAFGSATICAPGTTNCMTIDHLLIDTGSTGLRVFASEVAQLNLPAVDASNGSAAYDCVNFVDGSFIWGAVEKADVTLGGETANNVPIQLISGSETGVPSSCSNGSTMNENTEALLGANGILGVGLEPTDCYYDGASVCDPASGLISTPPSPAYYTCSGSTCHPAFIAEANQVANPVALFPADNNGVIVELPAVNGTAPSVTGSLIFGIGTESNNQLPSDATIFTLACDAFTTVLDNQTFGITDANTCSGPGSFIDTGSNGLYFPNAPNLPLCPSNTAAGNLSSYYCPASTKSLTATNQGEDGTSKVTGFSVSNAESLFTSPATQSDAAMNSLAGTNPAGAGFDWGLPFFFGANVYNAIDGKSVPSSAPPAPWWAY